MRRVKRSLEGEVEVGIKTVFDRESSSFLEENVNGGEVARER